jgi:hypothetical protein
VDSTTDHDVASNGAATTPALDIGVPPNVKEQGGQLIIQWPGKRGDFFVIRTSLFEGMIADINGGKRLAAALDRIKLTITELD